MLINNANKSTFYIFVLLFFTKIAFSQNPTWTNIGPNNINSSRCVLYDPNDNTNKKVWACGAGLWYNNDISSTTSNWVDVSQNFKYSCFYELVFHPTNPQIAYAIAFNCTINYYTVPNQGFGIYRTTNGGQSWVMVYENLQYNSTFINLKVDDSGNVYIIRNGYLIKSSDGGITWQTIFGTTLVNDYEFKGSTLIIGTQNGKIYKLDNGVLTNISPSTVSTTGRVEIASFSNDPISAMYVLCRENSSFKCGYKTIDNGNSWTAFSLPENFIYGSYLFDTYSLIFEVNPFNSNFLICGQNYLTSSTNGGQTWPSYNIYSLNDNEYAIKAVFNKNNSNAKLLIAKEIGIFTSTSWGKDQFGAISIEKIPNNLITANFDFISQPNKSAKTSAFIGNYDDGLNKMQSGNASEVDWRPCYWIKFDEDEHNKLLTYHGTYYNYNVQLRDSIGTLLRQLPIVVGRSSNANSDLPLDYNSRHNVIWAYNSGGSSFSNDLKFSKINDVGGSETLTTFNLSQVNDDFNTLRSGFDDSTFFWGGYNGYIYKTSYNNKSGLVYSTKLNSNNKFYSSILSIDANHNGYLICNVVGAESIDIWFSSNNGQTWFNKKSASLPVDCFKVRFNPNNPKQVVVCNNIGVWATDDITLSNPIWSKITVNLPNVHFNFPFFRTVTSELFIPTEDVIEKFWAAKYSRGIYKTDYYTNTVVKRIELSKKKTIICKTVPSVTIPFFEYGVFNKTVNFTLQISDNGGSFANPISLQTVPESPFNLNPANLNAGLYKIRVMSYDGFISDTTSFEINENLTSYINFPKITNITTRSAMLQAKYSIASTFYYIVDTLTSTSPSIAQIVGGLKSNDLNATIKGSSSVAADSILNFLIANLRPSSVYKIYCVAKSNDCFTRIETVLTANYWTRTLLNKRDIYHSIMSFLRLFHVNIVLE